MSVLTFKHYDDKRLKLISKFCTGGTILDLGYAQAPNPYLDAELTTGVDLNRNATNIRYGRELVGDILDIERVVRDRQFQNVVAGELIEHIEKPYEFLRSLHSVLQDGGRLILSTPNPVAWPTLLFEWTMSSRFFYTHEHKFYFSPRWVERLLDHCDYQIEIVKGVGLWSPLFTPPCPKVLSYQVVYVARANREPIETAEATERKNE